MEVCTSTDVFADESLADLAVDLSQQQNADDARGFPLRPGRCRRPAPAQEGVHQAPGNDEANPGQQQRRQQ